MDITERLKELRKEKGITQQKLAEALNLATSTVSGYEAGTKQPSLDTLVSLSNFFNVSTDYILGRTDKKTPAFININDRNIYGEDILISIYRALPDSLQFKARSEVSYIFKDWQKKHLPK